MLPHYFKEIQAIEIEPIGAKDMWTTFQCLLSHCMIFGLHYNYCAVKSTDSKHNNPFINHMFFYGIVRLAPHQELTTYELTTF